jgi:hypothetical protein
MGAKGVEPHQYPEQQSYVLLFSTFVCSADWVKCVVVQARCQASSQSVIRHWQANLKSP